MKNLPIVSSDPTLGIPCINGTNSLVDAVAPSPSSAVAGAMPATVEPTINTASAADFNANARKVPMIPPAQIPQFELSLTLGKTNPKAGVW